MYLLHAAEFPERPIPVDEVRKSWLAAGFPKFSVNARKNELTGHDVRGIVNAQLLAAGATMAGPDSEDMEVPDTARPLLEALERFYLALYPEMRDARPPRNFHYEKVEWLGEF